jgi:maltooligosyltrehalose trehalohydrolase
VCLQNHDQIGNRALGERLNHQVDLAQFRAASVVLLTTPQTPLLFMGQEWAASSPFQYFTDHGEDLGRLVTEGRRREFRDFSSFADTASVEGIPDPQALSTFLASHLDWAERALGPHASTERLYKALLAFRRQELATAETPGGFTAAAADEATIVVRRGTMSGALLVVAARFHGSGVLDLRGHLPEVEPVSAWSCVLTSEDPLFSPFPAPPIIDLSSDIPRIRFQGPAAVLLRSARQRSVRLPQSAGARPRL